MEDPLHREILEEHARSPRCQNFLDSFTHSANWISEKTGNRCEVTANINNQIVSDIYFKSQGSALSIACGSIMCCEVKGMGTREVKNLCFSLSEYVLKGTEFSLFGELEVYRTIIRFSERHDCSLLCWHALEKSLRH